MWEFLFLAIFGLFCVVIQTNPIANCYLFPIKPDFTIPLTLYICLIQKPVQGCFLAMWLGFLMDLFSGGVMGIFLFLRLVLFCFVQILKKLLFLENKVLWVGVVLLLFLLDSLLIHLLFGLMEKNWGTLEIILKTSMSQGFFTFLLSLLIFPLVNKIEKFIKERQTK
jgi:rod shape-determining protein MreD